MLVLVLQGWAFVPGPTPPFPEMIMPRTSTSGEPSVAIALLGALCGVLAIHTGAALAQQPVQTPPTYGPAPAPLPAAAPQGSPPEAP